MVLDKCRKVQVISMSKYASKRLNPNALELLSKRNIDVKVMIEPGRPSIIERRLYNVIL
jgi:hypothetical protein